MEYASPGFAASSAFQQVLLQDAALKRQAALDALNEKKVNSEIELGQAALQEKRNEAAEKVREKERAETERDVAGMAPGDIPDADLIARAKKHHIPLRTEPDLPTPIPEQFGQTATDTTGAVRYLGSPQQAIEAAKQKKIDAIVAQISGLDPTSPQFKQLAAQYEMIAGKSLPASFLGKTGTSDMEVVMRQHPSTGQVQRLIDGKFVDWAGDVPKGAHWMTVPDTGARDAARTAAMDRQLVSAQEKAYAEFQKRGQTTESQLQSIREAEHFINMKTPAADSLIAPLIIKSTISGTGSGFRMTQSEIDKVLGAGSHWDKLQTALMKWDTDHNKALALDDDMRDDMRKLARAIRDKAKATARKLIDARHAVDDAKDVPSVHKARTALQEALDFADPEEDGSAGGASGALPKIGDTYNGGKVLAVRPKVQ